MTGKPAPTPHPDEADFSNHTPIVILGGPAEVAIKAFFYLDSIA